MQTACRQGVKLNFELINDAWKAQRASCFCAFVARWYANVLQLHTRLEVELDHGRVGARSRAGSPPSESSGASTADGYRHIQSFYGLNCALSRDTPLRS